MFTLKLSRHFDFFFFSTSSNFCQDCKISNYRITKIQPEDLIVSPCSANGTQMLNSTTVKKGNTVCLFSYKS